MIGMGEAVATVRERVDEDYKRALSSLRRYRETYLMLDPEEREEIALLYGSLDALNEAANLIFGEQRSLF